MKRSEIFYAIDDAIASAVHGTLYRTIHQSLADAGFQNPELFTAYRLVRGKLDRSVFPNILRWTKKAVTSVCSDIIQRAEQVYHQTANKENENPQKEARVLAYNLAFTIAQRNAEKAVAYLSDQILDAVRSYGHKA